MKHLLRVVAVWCSVALPLSTLALLSSCHRAPQPDFAAAEAANDYYSQLIGGHAEAFVDGLYQPDTIPDSYRRQLIANARMFISQQETEHKGLLKVAVANCINDSLRPEAQAFLLLCYGDSSVEQVVVPMVKHDGRWFMK